MIEILLYVVLAAWIAPAALSYLIVAVDTGDWSLDLEKDWTLFAPGLCLVTFFFVLMIFIDEKLFNR
jgi:hypothetical protein